MLMILIFNEPGW
uniref:Uncharacterized protein n=1 Tax=Rhizophora mucronata TaxID=61149 RepID=A0A2P2Q376_RHIMU